MSDEASKTKEKFGELEKKIFIGRGIDIGCGNDPIFENVRTFDISDGDANKVSKYVHEKFDFVFSSHTLEHMIDPFKAISEWWKLVKNNGYMYIVVPDEDLYEQGVFPSRWNADHKHTFTIYKHKSWSKNSVNIIDLIKYLPDAKLLKLEIQDDRYDYKLKDIDQTYIGNNMTAMAQIVFALQKENLRHFSPSAHVAAISYSIKLFFQKRTHKLNNLLYFASSKLKNEKYSGISGKILFITCGIRWFLQKILHCFQIKRYCLRPNFFGKKIQQFFSKAAEIFFKPLEMDWLIIQPNGLGDAVINKIYIDKIIEKNNFNPDKVIMISLDQWQDFKPILYPNIFVYFLSLNKFEKNIFIKLKLLLFLKKYKFSLITCNLRWKARCITDFIAIYADGREKYFSSYQNHLSQLNKEFLMWCNEFGINFIATDNIENELERIPFFYNYVFKKADRMSSLRTQLSIPIEKYGLNFSNLEKYIIFHLGMSDKRRRWAIDKYIHVANYFKDEGYLVIFCGGEFEIDLKPLIPEHFPTYINELSAMKYSMLIRNASAMLCGDTGPAHLAIALNTPTVIILGGGHYGNYFPYPASTVPTVNNVTYVTSKKDCYKCDWECKQDKNNFMKCIHDIQAEDVISALKEILQKKYEHGERE